MPQSYWQLNKAIDHVWGPSKWDTAADYRLDSACTPGSSGDCLCVQFPGRAQTSSTLVLYLYVGNVGGSPVAADLSVTLYPGQATAPHLPTTASPIATGTASGAPAAASWATISLSSVTLTHGAPYVALVRNVNADPATNWIEVRYAGACHSFYDTFGRRILCAEYSANGGTSITANYRGPSPFGILFADGTAWGNAIAATTLVAGTAHHGLRMRPPGNLLLHAVCPGIGSGGSASTVCRVYSGSTLISTAAGSAGTLYRHNTFFFATPVLLRKGVTYDIMMVPNSTENVGYTSVLSAASAQLVPTVDGLQWSYVTGAAATAPASYAADTGKMFACSLFLSNVWPRPWRISYQGR